ncbi:HNH endonuclease signature motif containing protein [Rhodococcus sp. ABRD24]|uniref:HNH endonuclease n=1 Tax=Rhodococcus sp. ABRD24 TaxID=2507582 RepID=UPI001F6122C8|nr:HNH endonuclease signature motif containing protein [Rhodococcus sp. ABRD24]
MTLDRNIGDATKIDLLRALEELKAGCAAAQARVAADLDVSVRAGRAARGVPSAQQGRGIASEVALARRVSPHNGGRHLGLAKALVDEMPHTLALLERGILSEWRATILARETACLSREDRAAVDKELCADSATLDGLGDRAIAARAKALAVQRDAEAIVRRARKAKSDRRVTSRPAPDTMGYVTALLPVAQAVAVHASLARDADSILARGDSRSRSQIMADLLVDRVTGVSAAGAVPVTVNLVISDESLLAGGAEPAHLMGSGPIPAGIARQWITNAADDGRATLRRVYACPSSGALTAVESRSRCFPEGLARLIDLRDRTCRTPWCDASIRHRDHVRPHGEGGTTSTDNGAGLCAGCNYAKQGLGWSASVCRGRRGRSVLHVVNLRTPTGHRYRSTAPPLPTPLPTAGVAVRESTMENVLVEYLRVA